MATLEVHDSGNRVHRLRITRDNPVIFGTDPMCDVILDGPGVQPFHGRIRWSRGRYKADASPDVASIEVNGRAVKSKSIYQGDEIRVGRCRIFLMSLEDGPDHGEKTVIQDRPADHNPAHTPATAHAARPGPGHDFHKMEMAPPSIEAPVQADEVPRRHETSRALETADDLDPADLLKEMKQLRRPRTRVAGPRKKPLANLLSFDRAPGDDRVFKSPVVLGLIGTLAALVVISFVLYGVIVRANARRAFQVASEDFESGDFRNAIKGFDRFLVASPDDPRVDKARVLRAFARVRQHTGTVGASWGNALKEANAMVEEVGKLDVYRDVSVDLAAELRKVAEGLADRARELADRPTLAEAESAVRFHARVAGPAAGSLIEKSRVPEKLEKARAAIRKRQERADTLLAMDGALNARDPGDAYAARATLVRRYPDLAGDKEIFTRLARANDLVRADVRFDPSSRPAETEPHPEPLGPATSLVLRLDPGRPPASNTGGSVAYALADGQAVGVDVETGAPRWQVPVGTSSPFPPIAIPGDRPTALMVDARFQELIRVDARTGALIWRQELGGPVAGPPLILGNRILQATPDGRLLQVDMASGGLRGTLQLGRRLAHAPIVDDAAQHLYLVGDEDCLFILAPDPLACEAVEYLGHDAGSVPCPPGRAGRFFVLPENTGIDAGRWRVFVIDEAGTKLRQAQELPVGGWTTATPSASGSKIWSASDRGELNVFAVGLYDAKAPFTSVARVAPGVEGEGPAFPKARTEREFWLASGRSGRYELDADRQKISPAWSLLGAGPALAPVQNFDRLAVFTQQDNEGPGTALWGVDAAGGQVRWRTVLGSPWPIPLRPSDSGDALTTLASDGRAVALDREPLRSGGFLEQGLPRPGSFRVPAGVTQRIEVDGVTVLVPAADAGQLLVRSGGGDFKPIELPAPLGAPVLVLGRNLLIPGADGRAYLIDPRTGTSAADPYVPAFDRSKLTRWRTPVAVEGDAVVLADTDHTLRRMTVATAPRPRLVVGAELKLDRPIEGDPASTGPAVIVATADGRVRSLAARDLGPQGTYPLEGPRLAGPWIVAGHAFVADALGNLLAIAPDGRKLWSTRLRDTLPAGPPALLGGSAWVLGRDGSLQRFSLADGSPQGYRKLDAFPAGGLLTAGPDLVVPTGPGTVRLFDPAKEKGAPR